MAAEQIMHRDAGGGIGERGGDTTVQHFRAIQQVFAYCAVQRESIAMQSREPDAQESREMNFFQYLANLRSREFFRFHGAN